MRRSTTLKMYFYFHYKQVFLPRNRQGIENPWFHFICADLFEETNLCNIKYSSYNSTLRFLWRKLFIFYISLSFSFPIVEDSLGDTLVYRHVKCLPDWTLRVRMNRGRIFWGPIKKFVSAELVIRQARFGQHQPEEGLTEGTTLIGAACLREVEQDEDLGRRRRPEVKTML